MMKFRIKSLPQIGYFAQVKEGIFSGWKTIGKHTHGFGLYPENHNDHPLPDAQHATYRIKMYEQWAVWSKCKPTYKEI